MQDSYPGAIEMVYARHFLSKGDLAEAERFIQRSHPEKYTDFQVIYAEILNRRGKYRESEKWVEKALPGKLYLNTNDYGKLLKLKASNSHNLGNDMEAFRLQKEYEVFRDSVDEAKSRDIIKRYRIEYEVAAKEREITQQKMRIHNLVSGITVVALFIIVGAVAYAFWHRRRNRFYKDIVRQNRDFIERQNILTERINRRDMRIKELEEAQTATPAEEWHNGEEQSVRNPRVSYEMADDIFDRIQHLADNQQVWRDTRITRDTFADMVGCNRTYFTEVLKSKTGMGYSQYMNTCRVREAVKVLSDPNNDIPLKELSESLGFLTIQTFYSSFKKDIGMSPAAFRKSARAQQPN